MARLDPELCDSVAVALANKAADVLRALQVDKRIWVEVARTWWTSRQNIATGGVYEVLNIVFTSNAPQILMGQLTLLSEAGILGYNSIFLQGYLECYLKQRYPDISRLIVPRFHFSNLKIDEEITHPVYIPVAEAIRTRLITETSSIAEYSRRYGLTHISIFGPGIVGPSTEVIALLERVWSEIRPATVLDLFGGTGALGTVARHLGAEKVYSFDIAPSAADANSTDLLLNFRDICIPYVDLAIIDQFVEYTALVSKEFVPLIVSRSRNTIWNMGQTVHREAFEKLLERPELRKYTIRAFDINDTFLSLLTNETEMEKQAP